MNKDDEWLNWSLDLKKKKLLVAVDAYLHVHLVLCIEIILWFRWYLWNILFISDYRNKCLNKIAVEKYDANDATPSLFFKVSNTIQGKEKDMISWLFYNYIFLTVNFNF